MGETTCVCNERLGLEDLYLRGWNNCSIETLLLSNNDKTIEDICSDQTWDAGVIQCLENSDAWRLYRVESTKLTRSEKRERRFKRNQEKLLETAKTAKITVKQLCREDIERLSALKAKELEEQEQELLTKAKQKYKHRQITQPISSSTACIKPSRSDLQHKQLNYVRHELTEYDRCLGSLKTCADSRYKDSLKAYYIIRYRTLRRIGETYPYLQDECMWEMRKIPLNVIRDELPCERYRMAGVYQNKWIL